MEEENRLAKLEMLQMLEGGGSDVFGSSRAGGPVVKGGMFSMGGEFDSEDDGIDEVPARARA